MSSNLSSCSGGQLLECLQAVAISSVNRHQLSIQHQTGGASCKDSRLVWQVAQAKAGLMLQYKLITANH